MTTSSVVARPYAQAAFEYAHDGGVLAQWSDALALLSVVAADRRILALDRSPEFSAGQMVELLLAIGGEHFDPSIGNFLRLVVENGRLGILPDMATQFEQRRARAEERIDAQVSSAFALDEAALAKLGGVLESHLGRRVTLAAEVDPALIGGVVIRAGDTVIDASVRGRLAGLASHLNR